MSSKILKIAVYAVGSIGRIDIIGSIDEWGKNNAMDLRERCQAIKEGGATKCHVYLMTVGGDCFQANEIVNIIIEFFGSYTTEGGALVASAGTYIVACSSFSEGARNGQWMIHKPKGGTWGNETEIGNYLKLVQNMTVTYYDAYKAKLKKPEAEFKVKWDAGDFWMTTKEAEEWGFVDKVKDPVKIDPETAQAIKESGSPIAVAQTDIIHNNEHEMDLKAIAKSLGLPDTATEEQVNAKLAENASKATHYDTLKAEDDERKRTQKAANIKAELDKAEKEKRIKATARPLWQSRFEKDYEGTKALMDTLEGVVKPLSAEIKNSIEGKGVTFNGRNFEQLQDEDPELLAQLEDENPDAYTALFADWKKRNKIK